ncbi:MAG TPA: DUF4389 domain-containing protein [Micromonosporaceae bacterium]
MRAGRLIAVIVGGVLTAAGFCAVVAGVVLAFAHLVLRDSAGYYNTSTERVETPAAVIVDVWDGSGQPSDWTPTLRIRAEEVQQQPVFIGIAPANDVEAWLAGTNHTEVTRLRYAPLRVNTRLVLGPREVTPPATQSFWVASASGPGKQTLTWDARNGDWAVVIMRADARPGLAADVSAGLKVGFGLPLGLTLLGIGLLLLAVGIVIILMAVSGYLPPETGARRATAAGAYPVRLEGRLDPGLSRWLWLVKWFLAIPHLVVLALLWLAVVPLTAIAGVVILFTGRYPRGIFEFNVGVLRWGWRVQYYAFSALGTDRYPPFDLRPVPGYPADLEIDYPQRLSRGLVLVKWWLLAIPHYLVIGFFTGAWTGGWYGGGNDDWFGTRDNDTIPGGLITILVVIAVVILAFTARYPQPIFDFVLGMNRWYFRVLAYTGLMRDEYPPFRLDLGGADPGYAAEATERA